jgi:hypothetical protein
VDYSALGCGAGYGRLFGYNGGVPPSIFSNYLNLDLVSFSLQVQQQASYPLILPKGYGLYEWFTDTTVAFSIAFVNYKIL